MVGSWFDNRFVRFRSEIATTKASGDAAVMKGLKVVSFVDWGLGNYHGADEGGRIRIGLGEFAVGPDRVVSG